MSSRGEVRCEGYRRGGIMTLGMPAKWVRCTNPATMRMFLDQGEGEESFPACEVCLDECKRTEGVNLLRVERWQPTTEEEPDGE